MELTGAAICRRSKALLNTTGVEFEMKDVENSEEFTEEAQSNLWPHQHSSNPVC
jgi:glutaredoxin